MPYRNLCKGVQREGAELSPALAPELFCYVPLHKIWYGVMTTGQCELLKRKNAGKGKRNMFPFLSVRYPA
jgi:hypothetical protein